ncbi:hypothetical protein D3C85_1896310 [compost metagenome]
MRPTEEVGTFDPDARIPLLAQTLLLLYKHSAIMGRLCCFDPVGHPLLHLA